MKIPSLRFWFVLASTCALAASLHAQADKAETAKLEGTWVGGVRFPAGKNKGGNATMVQISEMTIKDGKIVACKDGKGLSLGNCESLALDPAKKTLYWSTSNPNPYTRLKRYDGKWDAAPLKSPSSTAACAYSRIP